jgi:Transposase DDE domain.
LGLHLEAGNVHDLKAAVPVLKSIWVPRRNGRARSRPGGLAADKGYDSLAFRAYLRSRGIRHSIAQKQTGIRHFKTHRDLAANRWKVERFFAWLNGFRRLGIRFERHSFIYAGFLILAAIIICLRSLLQ